MSLAAEYNQIVDDQAPDWSNLFFELSIPDESKLDEARLLLAPVQLERIPGERHRFSFRVSSGQGYGVYAPLAAASLAKLDDRNISGVLTLERSLRAGRHNLTQGPA